MNEVHIVDLDTLLETAQRDVGLAVELINLFIATSPPYVEQLTVDATPEAWHAAAHTLKGSSSAIAAMKLADLCKKAERVTDPDERQKARTAIAQAFDETVIRLEQAVRELQAHDAA